MRAGLAFSLIGAFTGLPRTFQTTHAVVLHAPVALLSAMPQTMKQSISNLGKRAEKFSCLPSPQEAAAAADATTEAHAMMSDDDAAAAANDEAGSKSSCSCRILS